MIPKPTQKILFFILRESTAVLLAFLMAFSPVFPAISPTSPLVQDVKRIAAAVKHAATETRLADFSTHGRGGKISVFDAWRQLKDDIWQVAREYTNGEQQVVGGPSAIADEVDELVPTGETNEAQLLVRVTEAESDDDFEPGDVVHAFNRKRILTVHAQSITAPRNFGFGEDGLRESGILLEAYLKAAKEYKFERISETEVKRTNLKTGEVTTIDGEPNEDGEHMDVSQFIQRRLTHAQHLIFGEPGSEYWYGGSENLTDETLSKLWDAIESETDYRRDEITSYPVDAGESSDYRLIPVQDFSDEEAGKLTANEGEELEGAFLTPDVEGSQTSGVFPASGGEQARNDKVRRKYQIDLNRLRDVARGERMSARDVIRERSEDLPIITYDVETGEEQENEASPTPEVSPEPTPTIIPADPLVMPDITPAGGLESSEDDPEPSPSTSPISFLKSITNSFVRIVGLQKAVRGVQVAVNAVKGLAHAPFARAAGTVTTSIGSNDRNTNISAVSGTGPWTVTITDGSVAKIGDALFDEHATPRKYLITGVSGNDLTVRDSEGVGGAPDNSGTSTAQVKRYYATMTLWEADLDDTGIYASTDDAQGEVYNDGALDELVTINGGATVNLDNIILTAADGEQHDGTEGTGARIVRGSSGGNGSILNIETTSAIASVTIEDLEIDGNAQTLHNFGIRHSVSGFTTIAWIRRNIVHGLTSNQTAIGIAQANESPYRFLNNIVYDITSTSVTDFSMWGIAGFVPFSGSVIANNTVHNLVNTGGSGGAVGISMGDSSGHTLRNNYATLPTGGSSGTKTAFSPTDAAASSIIASHNASTDDTAPDRSDDGTALHSITAADQFVSLTGGSEDLHLKAGADLIDAGFDFATTPTGVNIDIDGNDREGFNSNWDIGAHQYYENYDKVITSIGSGTSHDENVTISSVAGANPYVVTLSAASGAVVGDALWDEHATPRKYRVIEVNGDSSVISVIDSEGVGAAPDNSATSTPQIKRYYNGSTPLTDWEADLDDTNLYSSGDDAVGHAYNDAAFTISSTILINGGGTVGLNSITLTAPEGERHDGTAGSGARIVITSNTTTGVISTNGAIDSYISWLEITSTAPDYTTFLVSMNGNVAGKVSQLNNCIIHGAFNNAGSSGVKAIATATNNLYWRIFNNIIYDISYDGSSDGSPVVGIQFGAGDFDSYTANNTIYDLHIDRVTGTGSITGIESNNDANEFIHNNIIAGMSHAGSGSIFPIETGTTNPTISHNATDESSITGSNGVTSITPSDVFESITGGSEDLHLKSTATDVIDAGTDLGQTLSGVEFDIDGRDRHTEDDTWDIGADELPLTTISGTVYSGEGTGALTSRDIRLAINGTDSTSTTTNGSGQYSFLADLSASDVITVYLEDETEDGVAVTVAQSSESSSTISSLDIYQNYLNVYNHNGGATTNANLSTAAVGSETDISNIYAVSAGNLTVASGKELFIASSQSFTPGGDVTTPTLDVRGTYTQGTDTLTISSNYQQSSGTFTGGSGAIDINGSFTLAGGTFTNSSGDMTVTTNFTRSGGTFTNTGNIVELDGTTTSTVDAGGTLSGTLNINKSLSSADVTIASGTTVDLGADPTSTMGGSGDVDLINNGTIDIPSGTWTVNTNGSGGPVDLTNNGTIDHQGNGWVISTSSGGSSGVFTNSSGATITYSGTAITMRSSFTQSGTFDLTGKTVTFDGSTSSATHTVTASGALGGTVVISDVDGFAVAAGTEIDLGATPTSSFGGGGTRILTNNGTITIPSGTWTVNGLSGTGVNVTNNNTITHSGNGWDMNLNSGGAFTNSSGATTTYSGTNLTVTGSFTQNGTFDLSGKTVTLDGTADLDDATLTCGSTFTGSIVINKTHASGNTTLGSNCTVEGDFTRTDGPITNPASAYTLTVQGDVVIDTTDTTGGANFTLAFGGTSAQTFDINTGDFDGHVEVNKSSGAVTMNDTLTLATGNLTITDGAFNLNGQTLNMSGGGTFSNNDTLRLDGDETFTGVTNDTDSGTVMYKGTSNQTGLAAGDSYYNLNINDGLVGYWKFDETSAGTFADSSGYGNTGTGAGATGTNNTPQPTDTKATLNFTNAKALDFDGSDDDVRVNDDSSLHLTTQGTISLWVKPDSTTQDTYAGFVTKNDEGSLGGNEPGAVYWFTWRNTDGTIQGGIGNGVSINTITTPKLTDTNWHHLVFSWDGSNLYLYKDGSSAATPVSQTVNAQVLDDRLRIGGDTFGQDSANVDSWDGQLDDVRIYNRALSTSEVSALAAGNQPGTATATYTLDANLDINGDLTLAAGGLNTSGTDYDINTAGSWLNYGGVLTPNSSMVTLDGTNTGKTLQTGAQQFADLTISGSGGGWTLVDDLYVDGTLSQSNGTLNTDSSNDYDIYAQNLSQTAGTLTPNSSRITVDSSSSQTLQASSSLYDLDIGDGLKRGLVGHWKMDEGTDNSCSGGEDVCDSTTNANHGTGTNWEASKWVAGAPTLTYSNPYALDFDGTDDEFALASPLDFAGDFSTSVWFNRNNTSNVDGLFRDSITENVYRWASATSFTVRTEADAAFSFSFPTHTSGTWHHFVLLRNNGTVRAYLDGTESTTGGVSDNGNVGIGFIGDSHTGDGTNTFDGQLDDVRIYNRALTASEVSALANGGHDILNYATTDTFTLGADLDIDNDLTINSGVLAASTFDITIGNDWINHVGNSGFTAGTGTVTLDNNTASSNQEVLGSTTFATFIKSVTNAATITFEAGKTFVFSTLLRLKGAVSNLLSVVSSVSDTAFEINPTSVDLQYLNISDANNTSGTDINTFASTDGGGNSNILFNTFVWDGGGDGTTCSDANNWDYDTVPTSSDGILIRSGSDSITWDASCPSTVSSMELAGTYSGTVTLSGSLAVSNDLTIDEGTLQTGKDVTSNITVTGTLNVQDGGTLVVRRSSTSGNGAGQAITAGTLTIDSGGSVNADGEGFATQTGPGIGTLHDGGSHGGKGGDSGGDGSWGATYGSISNPTSLGSGSQSSGGAGGGAVIISSAGTVTVNGTLSANGTTVSTRGGAGGSINITANTLTGTGTIRANGGGSCSSNACGGGGRISFDGVTTDTFTGTLTATGGSGGGVKGHAGTIYLNAAKRSNLTLGGGGNLTSLRLGSDDSNSYTFGTITIQSGGTLEIDSNPSLNSGSGGAAIINVTTLDVQSGGVLSGEGLGFDSGRGPGKGGGFDGGTYGGEGGDNSSNGVGTTYGSIIDPVFPGSGASAGTGNGNGGGAIIISASGAVTVNGTIQADGTRVTDRGGSGGSVNIVADSISGSGTVRASGAGGTNNANGSGGGGRVAVALASGTSFGSLTFQAFGGLAIGSGISGAAGTVYLEDANDGSGDGELIINNNSTSTASGTDTLISSSVTDTAVGDVTIQNAGKLQMASSTTLTVSGDWANTAGTALTAGTVDFDLGSGTQTIDSGSTAFYNLTHSGAGTAQITDEALTISNNFTNSAGTFDLNAEDFTVSGTVSNDGTVLLQGDETVSWTNDTNSGAVKYDGSGTYASGLVAGDAYYDLEFDGSGSWTLDAALDTNNNLTITNGTLIDSGNAITIGGNWSNAGTYTGTSTVTFDKSSGTQTLTSGGTGTGNDFQNITKSGGGTLQFVTNAVDIDGTLTIDASTTVDLNGQNITVPTLVNNGTLLAEGGETITIATKDTDTGLVKYDGSGSYTTALAYGNLYYDLEFDGAGVWEPDGAVTTNNNLNITNGTFDIDSQNLTVTGTFSNDGTLRLLGTETLSLTHDTNSGTVTYDNTATLTDFPTNLDDQYYSVTFGGTGLVQLANDLDANGNLTISSGAELDLNGFDLTIGGNMTNSGTLTNATPRSITLDGTTQTFSPSNITFANLFLTGASGTVTLGSNFTLSDLLSIAAGRVLSLSNSILTALNASITNAGTITEGGSGYIRKDATSFYIADDDFDEDPGISLDSELLYLSITDEDSNKDGQNPDTIASAVTVACPNDEETVSLTETGNATEVFRYTTGLTVATYDGAATNNDGTLECSDSDTITATFTDPQDSADTEQDTAVATTDTVPTAPSSLAGSADSSTAITWTWTDNSNNEVGFKLYDATDDSLIATIATVGATSYQETGLSAGTTYQRYVVAYNVAGNSDDSNTASEATNSGAPAAPSSLAGTANSGTAITWTWTDNASNEVGFKVFNADDNSLVATISTANTTSYQEASLSAGTTYNRYVKSYNATADSAASNTASVATDDSQPPNAFALISPNAGAVINDTTPTFSFFKAEDQDDGIDDITLFVDTSSYAIPGSAAEAGGTTYENSSVVAQYFNENDGNPINDTIYITLKNALLAGSHTWYVVQTDAAGNNRESGTRSFTIDTENPGFGTLGNIVTGSQQPTVRIDMTDNHSLGELVVTLERAITVLGVPVSYTSIESSTFALSGTSATVQYTPGTSLVVDATYRLRLALSDTAGNEVERSITVRVASDEQAQRQEAEEAVAELDADTADVDEIIQRIRQLLPDPPFAVQELERFAVLRRERQAQHFEEFFEQIGKQISALALYLQRSGQGWLLALLEFAGDVSDRMEAGLLALSETLREQTRLAASTIAHGWRLAIGSILNGYGRIAVWFSGLQLRLAGLFGPPDIDPSFGVAIDTQQLTAQRRQRVQQFTEGLVYQRSRIAALFQTGQDTRVREGLRNRQRLNNLITSWWGPLQEFGTKVALVVRYNYEIIFDREPTHITNVRVTTLTPTSAVIEWNTNHLTRRGKVNYGTAADQPYTGEVILGNDLSNHHRAEIADLAPGTTYYFEVANQNGDYVFDAYYSVTTPEEGEITGTLAPQDAVILAPDASSTPDVEEAQTSGVSPASDVEVHTSPDPESSVVLVPQVGDRFRALTVQGGWVSVLLPSGQEGWVEISSVELVPQQQPSATAR